VKRSVGKFVPAFLCAAVIAVVAALQWMVQRSDALPFLHKLEWMTFDWRVRAALNHPSTIATNLGFIWIDEETIIEVHNGRLGVEADLYWPRHVYGRVVQELDTQGVEAVGFDVVLNGYRSTDEPMRLPDDSKIPSDHWFALQLQSAGNVILGSQTNGHAYPPPLFRTTAWALGDVSAQRDHDGILRRARAFEDYVIWDERILESHRTFDGFTFSTNRLIFRPREGQPIEIPVAPDGTYELATLIELGNNTKLPAGTQRFEKAFTRYRAWNLGIALAAHHLALDLANARIEPGRDIVLKGTNGFQCVIPIDRDGFFLIDWSIPVSAVKEKRLTGESFHSLLRNHRDRSLGLTNAITNRWQGKLALVGSLATGNDLTDTGATALDSKTFFTTSLWNIANSVLTNRFIQPSSPPINVGLIALLGLVGSWVTWKSRTLAASLTVALIGIAYTGVALYAYVHSRYWLPLVLPLTALIFTHFALLTYRVVFEQKERRRIRNVFARIVSPNVVTELLKAEKLSVSGARREVTVFFSDIRGFTEMTDEGHARAEEHVRAQKLSGADAEAYFDEQAAEVLATVNRFLSAIADKVKEHEGTLDKYIGDCVMAFWGAPTPNPRHAVSCVRAAIDAQRAIAALNEERAIENLRRERENAQRATQRIELMPLLKPLHMGSGINTGIVTIGLMGSEQHISNYTVFGREVNLASRLESLSGRGRIVISESTFKALQRDEPELAVSCRELPAATVKGFRTAVKVYEVPWKTAAGSLSFEFEQVMPDGPARTASTPTAS